MNVLKGYTTAVLMPFATIPTGRTTVHVNLDSLEMGETAKVQFSALRLRLPKNYEDFVKIKIINEEKTLLLQVDHLLFSFFIYFRHQRVCYAFT